MKKSLFVFLLILISFGVFAYPDFDIKNTKKTELKVANELTNKETYKVNDKEFLPIGKNFGYYSLDVEQKNLFVESTKTYLPSKYNLKDYNYISPIRDQYPYGTCWAHGSLASLESSALRKYGYDSISFSPLNMANKTLWPF